MPENFDKNDNMSDNNSNVGNESDIVWEEDADAASAAARDKKLRARLEKCIAERDEYLTGWQRAKADFVNARRVEAEERTQAIARAIEKTIKEFLPALDSFDMAFADQSAWQAAPTEWRTGIEQIHTQLLEALKRCEVVAFDPVGEVFDPSLHTAIATVPTEKPEDDHRVIAVAQKGYKTGNRVLRPAAVTIAVYE